MSGFQAAQNSTWRSTGEPEVVRGPELAAILQRFVDRWNANRPNGTGQYGNRNGGFVGPLQYLANQTGINIRQVGAYANGERKYVGLGKADALLQALDTGEHIDLDLEVIPNPTWNQERWHAYMAERGCV